MRRPRPIFLSLLAWLLPLCASICAVPARAAEQAATRVDLQRGPAEIRFYAPRAKAVLKGFVLFGSGDGGWSYWEERVSAHLAAKGFAVAGIDFQAYAQGDYTAGILRRDYATLAAELRRRHPDAERAPVFYGGWSMGAEQSLPAAAEAAGRAPGLRGLILVSPGARGRFGLHLRDRMGFAPAGPGTFGLRELAPRCADLRMAVFHGGLDPLDDLDWSKNLPLDLRRWTIPRVFHDFGGAGPEFLAALDEALAWLLRPTPGETPASP